MDITRTSTLRATHDKELITVVPTANFAGTDSLSYTIRDSFGQTATAWVRISFIPVNDPPTQPNDYIIPVGSSEVFLVLQGSDVDSEIEFNLVSLPSDGTLTNRNRSVIETVPYVTSDPILVYLSSFSNRRSVNFQYTVTDGQFTTNRVTVQLVKGSSDNVTQTIALSSILGFLGLWFFCALVIWLSFIIKKKYFTDEEANELELSSMSSLLGDLRLQDSPLIIGHGLSLTSSFGTAIAGSWNNQNVLTKSIPFEDLSLYKKFTKDSEKYLQLRY